MNPKYPVYVPSRGRSESRLTTRCLDFMGVPYRVVIEPPEYDLYAPHYSPEKILVIEDGYWGKGVTVVRNWIWEHAISEGAPWFWQLDDNIRGFYRLNKNMKVMCSTGAIFRISEMFAERFDNVAQLGMQYESFTPRRHAHKMPPFTLNTRIYSMTLMRTDLPFRYRSFFNEDTELSLQLLKAGWCTILMYAFNGDKSTTMTVKGGNTPNYVTTQEGLQKAGRLEMARQLVELHPDVTKVVYKWGRYQHEVDYSPFKNNKLLLKQPITEEGPDECGMELEHLVNGQWETGHRLPSETEWV